MDRYLGKKYKQVNSENMDTYLKEMGLNIVMRKFITMSRATTSLTKKDETFTLTVSFMGVNHNIVFKLGEEILEDTFNERKCKTIFTLKDNTLTQHQLGEKETYVDYIFSDDELEIVMRYKDIISTRTSKLVE